MLKAFGIIGPFRGRRIFTGLSLVSCSTPFGIIGTSRLDSRGTNRGGRCAQRLLASSVLSAYSGEDGVRKQALLMPRPNSIAARPLFDS